jgi:hypothetical protein
VSTGAMTGADAPALRALAAQMSQSATRLDGIRQGIRSRLYSVHWDGPDGATFRRLWDGQHVPMLVSVTDGLRGSAERLLVEAEQQEAASTVASGGGQTIGPASGGFVPADDGNGFLGTLEDTAKAASMVLGGSKAFYELMVRGYGQEVSGYLRANGTWVDGYMRWSAGHAGTLNRWLGSVDEVTEAAEKLGRVGKVLPYVGGAFSAYNQWQEDAGHYGDGERAARAAGAAAFSTAADIGGEYLAVGAGAAIGTAIFPGVGTVVGGAIGWVVATGATTYFGDEIQHAGAWVGSAAYSVGEDLVDFGGDVLDAGGDLLGDIGEGAADLWEDLTPW